VHPLNPELVENRNGVANSVGKRVRARFAGLVAPTLTAMVGEDQSELAA